MSTALSPFPVLSFGSVAVGVSGSVTVGVAGSGVVGSVFSGDSGCSVSVGFLVSPFILDVLTHPWIFPAVT